MKKTVIYCNVDDDNNNDKDGEPLRAGVTQYLPGVTWVRKHLSVGRRVKAWNEKCRFIYKLITNKYIQNKDPAVTDSEKGYGQ
jgi:hypothetical protein